MKLFNLFDDIIERKTLQLSGMDFTKVVKDFGDNDAKRRWWKNRLKLDEKLEKILNKIQRIFFGSDVVHKLFNRELENGRCDAHPGSNAVPLRNRFQNQVSLHPLMGPQERKNTIVSDAVESLPTLN